MAQGVETPLRAGPGVPCKDLEDSRMTAEPWNEIGH